MGAGLFRCTVFVQAHSTHFQDSDYVLPLIIHTLKIYFHHVFLKKFSQVPLQEVNDQDFLLLIHKLGRRRGMICLQRPQRNKGAVAMLNALQVCPSVCHMSSDSLAFRSPPDVHAGQDEHTCAL
jgi:hypothetical protein